MDIFFQELSGAARRISSIVTDTQGRTYWAYLLLSLVLAIGILTWRRARESADHEINLPAAVRALFARSIWLHRSAITDYACYAINATLFSFLGGAGVFAATLSISLFYPLLLKAGGGGKLAVPVDIFAIAIYTIFVMVWQDLGRYASHWLLHRVPALWEFHKVHHSAQVLTPVTLFRIHPCDFVFTGVIAGVFAGSAVAVGLFVFANRISPVGIFGIDISAFLFYVLGANLAHSHVWLAYPGWLARIILSPAQHQIHHSSSPHHHNANLGVIFAFWDWIFGTLYVPEAREPLSFGLADGEDRDYQSVSGLYLAPFRKTWTNLRGKG